MKTTIQEKLGQELFCIKCGLNYNVANKRSAPVICFDGSADHTYKSLNCFKIDRIFEDSEEFLDVE